MREVSNGQLVGTGPEGPGRTATNPSPVRAQQPCMCHGWSLMALRVRNWEISMMVMESFMSCLLAKMRMEASRRACGQRNPAPVSLPGPSIPSHYPHEPSQTLLLSQQDSPMPRWARMEALPNSNNHMKRHQQFMEGLATSSQNPYNDPRRRELMTFPTYIVLGEIENQRSAVTRVGSHHSE